MEQERSGSEGVSRGKEEYEQERESSSTNVFDLPSFYLIRPLFITPHLLISTGTGPHRTPSPNTGSPTRTP